MKRIIQRILGISTDKRNTPKNLKFNRMSIEDCLKLLTDSTARDYYAIRIKLIEELIAIAQTENGNLVSENGNLVSENENDNRWLEHYKAQLEWNKKQLKVYSENLDVNDSKGELEIFSTGTLEEIAEHFNKLCQQSENSGIANELILKKGQINRMIRENESGLIPHFLRHESRLKISALDLTIRAMTNMMRK